MCLDCSGVTMENSAISGFFLIRCGDSVVLVTLTAILLSIFVELEWENSRPAVSVNFSNGVTVPVVFHSDGWSTKSVIDGIVRVSSVMTGWGFAFVSLETVLIWIVRWGKCMSTSVVSMTTLVLLMKCNSIIGPVNFFITRKCSTNILSPVSSLSVAVANGFSNWPFATFIWEMGGSSNLKILSGAFCFIVSKLFWAITLK